MQIEYTEEEGGRWTTGTPENPLHVAEQILRNNRGLPEGHYALDVVIEGTLKHVRSVRFPVTEHEWDAVNGFRSTRRAWVWPLVYALAAAVAVLAWLLL